MSIETYKSLIQAFVGGAMTANNFRTRFVESFLNEPGIMREDLFFILQDLFEDVEAFREEWPPPPGLVDTLISEDQLRHEARKALNALSQLDDI